MASPFDIIQGSPGGPGREQRFEGRELDQKRGVQQEERCRPDVRAKLERAC